MDTQQHLVQINNFYQCTVHLDKIKISFFFTNKCTFVGKKKEYGTQLATFGGYVADLVDR